MSLASCSTNQMGRFPANSFSQLRETSPLVSTFKLSTPLRIEKKDEKTNLDEENLLKYQARISHRKTSYQDEYNNADYLITCVWPNSQEMKMTEEDFNKELAITSFEYEKRVEYTSRKLTSRWGRETLVTDENTDNVLVIRTTSEKSPIITCKIASKTFYDYLNRTITPVEFSPTDSRDRPYSDPIDMKAIKKARVEDKVNVLRIKDIEDLFNFNGFIVRVPAN